MKLRNLYLAFLIKKLKPRIRDRESEYVSASRKQRLISFSEPVDFSISIFFFKLEIRTKNHPIGETRLFCQICNSVLLFEALLRKN